MNTSANHASALAASRLRQATRSLLTAAVLVALSGVGTAHAQTVITTDGGVRATGINDLDVAGTLYNVVFTYSSASNLYGADPIVFDFDNYLAADNAMNAAVAALNTTLVQRVGDKPDDGTGTGESFFGIGFGWQANPDPRGDDLVFRIEGTWTFGSGDWLNNELGAFTDLAATTYAVFTVVPDSPTLRIATAGSEVVVSWPTNGTTGYQLESAPSLTSPVTWSSNGPPPVVVGELYMVTNAVVGSQEWYRLAK